jgi:hypothetical protein
LRCAEYCQETLLRNVLREICAAHQSVHKPVHRFVVIVEYLFRYQVALYLGITRGTRKRYGQAYRENI